MNRVELLYALKAESLIATKGLLMPVAMQEHDKRQPPDREADVYLMRLPNSKAAKKKAPYILHQFITGYDQQPEGDLDESSATIRTIFAVYSEDEQEGGLILMNLMERVRIHLLRKVVIDHKFELDKQVKLEALAYPDDTAPYFAGEMISTWKCPAVKREVTL